MAHQPNLTEKLDSRREFLAKIGKGALLASLGVFGAGCEAVDQGLLGRGLMPVVLMDAQEAGLPKPNMLVHSENPFNGEFAPHLLNGDVTPTAQHFVRHQIDTLGPIGKPNSLLQIEATMKSGHARMTIQVQRSHSTNPGTPKVTSEMLFTGYLFL